MNIKKQDTIYGGFKVAEKIAEAIDAPFNTTNFGWMAEGEIQRKKSLCPKAGYLYES